MNLTYQVVATKDPIDGVLVTKHEISSIHLQHRKKQENAKRGQKPLEKQRQSQLFVTSNQASQLMILKKPFTRARICLAESLYELEALLGHIKASTVFSELQEFYSFSFNNNRKRKTFHACSPTRCICRRERRDWGYWNPRRGKRSSFNDLCLCSSLPRNNVFRHAIQYKGANTTWSSNHNKSQAITLSRATLGPSTKSTREGFHGRVVQIRQDSALVQRRRSFKVSNNGTLRSESSFFHMQDPYEHDSISEPETIKQAYPSNEADRSKSRKGSRDYPALVPFSGSQSKDDANNALLNHGGILKLVCPRQTNQVGQPGIRDLSDNTFVEISKEVEDNNKHNASEFLETVDGGNQLVANSVTKQYDAHRTSQQLSFYTGYASLVKSSMEQFQEMRQSGRENRSSIRNKQVQQVQSVDPNQLAADTTKSSGPVYGEERKLKSDMRNKETQESSSRFIIQDEELLPILSVEGRTSRLIIQAEEPQDPSDPRFAVKGRESSLISQDVEPCVPILGEEARKSRFILEDKELQITPRSVMAEKRRNSMFMDRDEELFSPNISEDGTKSRFFTVTTMPTRLNSSIESFDGVQPEQLQTPRLIESRKSRMSTEIEEGATVAPSDYERSLPSQQLRSPNQTSVHGFNMNKRNMCKAILRVADLEGRKSRLVLGDEVKSPLRTSILSEGRKLNVMMSDEKPFSLAEGTKSKSIMERHDEDSGAYFNYRRSFSVSHPAESSSSLQNFDNVQQDHTHDPRLADRRNSRMSINMEEDTLQSPNCQRNSISHCPSTTRASTQVFNAIKPEMKDTSMAASCLFDVQVPYENNSISEHQTYPNVVQHRENQKYYPSNDADSRQSRKGSRDYPDVVLFYGAQSKDDSNNMLQNHKSLVKLGASCQPNQIACTVQPENRDLPRDDSAKMSKEKENTHQHFIASLVDISGAKGQPGQSGTSDTSQQVSSEPGYPCQIKLSEQQIQDMMQYESKNRSTARKSRQQVQPFSSYMQSQRQPLYQYQVAADGMRNVEPRESIPADLSPHLQSSDLVENEMDCNPETGIARKSICMEPVKSKDSASRINIQTHKSTANYRVPDTVNDISQPKNELVTTITQPVESSMQDKSNPFYTISESSGSDQTRGYPEESDVQGIGNRLSDEVISRRNQFGQMHKSTEAHILQSSLHLEQRESTLSVNKEFWQSLLGSEYMEGKLSRLGVSDTSQERKSALQDGVSSATIFAAEGRKSRDILQEKQTFAPTFMEGRKSKDIVQNKECPSPMFTADKSKSNFMLQDMELRRPTATSFVCDRRESSFISHHDELSETEALAVVTQLEGTRSRSVSRDEKAESSALTSLPAKGSKLRLFFGNEEPVPLLARERKSRIEENLPPSLDHQKGLSVSCSANSSRCVEVEHLQDPKLLESRRASIGVGNTEDGTAPLDHQRNPNSRMSSQLSTTLASMRNFNMVKPSMEGTLLTESSFLCVQDSIENGSIPEPERNIYLVQHITSPQPYPLIDADRRQSRKASRHYPEIAPVTGIQSKIDEVTEFANNDLVKMLKGEDDRQQDSGVSRAHGGNEQRTNIPRRIYDMSQELLSEARYSFLRKNLQKRRSSVQKLIKQVQPCTSYRQSQIQSKDPNPFAADGSDNVKPRARKHMNHSVDFNIALCGHPSSDLQSSKSVEYETNPDAAKNIARKSMYMELGQNEEPASKINIQATAANNQPKIYAEGKSVYQGWSNTNSTQEFCVMDSEGESSLQDEFYPMGIVPIFSNQLQIPSNSEEGVAQALNNRFSYVDISTRNQILQMCKSEEGKTPHTLSPEEGGKSKLAGQPSTANQILMRGFDMNKLIESESLAVGAELEARNSTFVPIDNEAEGPPSDPILAKGRKSNIIIDKDDENATTSSDYQRGPPVSSRVRSSNPMLRFSAVELEHPHTPKLSESRPFEREEDSTPSSYQKNPTFGRPNMTQAWMRDFQMMIKPSMKTTSMTESPSFSVEYTCENGSIWKHETNSYDVKYGVSPKPSTSNGTDIRHIRKGNRDYQDVAPFSGTQSKNENNNHQPNPIVFSRQQEISGFPEDDSVQMLQEVKGSTQQTSNHIWMDLRDEQRTDQRKSQSGTPNTPQQLHSEARHSSLKRNSRDQLQETSHFDMNSRSSVRKSLEIQQFSSDRKSQIRSMDRNQVSADALGSVEPRENMPSYPNEGFSTGAYSHPNPDSQSIDLVEYEMNVNQETGTARMSMYLGPVLPEEPMFRNSIQEFKNTANYVGPDTRNVKRRWSTNELMTEKDQSNPYLRESSSMYQGRSSTESMQKLDPGNSQGEQSSQHEPSPRSGSSASHHSASYSKENDVQGPGNRFSESLSHAEGRKSTHNVHNMDLQCPLAPVFGDEKKSSYNVRDEEFQRRKSSFMEQSAATFAGERIKPGSTLVNEEPSAPTFAGEGRVSMSISQNEELSGPKIAGETDKPRLTVQEKEPEVASSFIMAAHGRNSMVIDMDKEPSASFFSGEGRKSSYLMKRDDNPVAYSDYKRNLFAAEPTKSRCSLPSFDSASQESPRLSERKKFKISFESEDDASSPYKSASSVSSGPVSVPQSIGSFNEESEDPMSSHCQKSLSITHSAMPISSMQRLDGARLEHPQPPTLVKSWMSLEREQDATPSDYHRKLTSSRLSSTTVRSMRSFSMIEPNQTLAVAWSDGVRAKIVLGDEEGNSQSTVPIFAKERKLGFMVTNRKPDILAKGRNSRIIMESNDEDLDASFDYERASSSSHSEKPSKLVQIFDGVQLEQPQAPNFSGSRKSKMIMEKEEDAILSGDQRNSTFNLPCRSTQSEGMKTELALGNEGDSRHPTPTFSETRESSVMMSDEELSISAKGRKSRILIERDDEDPAAFSGFERDLSVSHSSKISHLRNTTSSHSFATRTSVRAFDLMEPNKLNSTTMSKVIGRSEWNSSKEVGTPTDNWRNSSMSWPSATQVPIGDYITEPNEREVIRRSEWNITSEVDVSEGNWKKCISSRQDVGMIEPNESEVIFNNDVSTCIDDWSNSTSSRPSTIRVSIQSFDVTEPIENEVIFTNEVDTSRYNWRTSTSSQPSTTRASMGNFDVMEPNESEFIFTDEVGTSTDDWRSWLSTTQHSMQGFDLIKQNEDEVISRNDVGTSTDSCLSATQESMRDFDSIEPNESEIRTYEWNVSNEAARLSDYQRNSTSNVPSEIQQFYTSRIDNKKQDKRLNRSFQISGREKRHMGYNNPGRSLNILSLQSLLLRKNAFRYWGHNNPTSSSKIACLQPPLSRKNAFRYEP